MALTPEEEVLSALLGTLAHKKLLDEGDLRHMVSIIRSKRAKQLIGGTLDAFMDHGDPPDRH